MQMTLVFDICEKLAWAMITSYICVISVGIATYI